MGRFRLTGRGQVFPAALGMAGLLGLATTFAGGVAHGEVSAAPSVTPSAASNQLLDGDGSAASCSKSGWDELTLPGWTISGGAPGFVCYGNDGGFPDNTVPGAQPGNGYFVGGARGASSLTQTVNVAADATAIDAGTASYNLAGWLGGTGSTNDSAQVTATFLDANGKSVGSGQLAPVTAADRNNTTEFLQRTASAAIPPQTRSISVVVGFNSTGAQFTNGYAANLSLTVTPDIAPPAISVPPSTVPGYDHVFFVMMENENESTTSNTADGGAGIIGNSAAPYLNSLAQQHSLLTDYHASTHNSDPNYLSVAGGQTFGQTAGNGNTSNCVASCTYSSTSLADLADSAGKTWKQYAEDAKGDCDTKQHGSYYPDDVPFYYFSKMKQDKAYCAAHWQPMTQLTTDLQSAATTPNFVWFGANDCHDMEACGIASGDTWLQNTLPQIFNSPAWTQQRSLLIITFDEDGNNSPGGFGPGQVNQVATIVAGSQNTTKAGYQSTARYDHYSSARTIEQALGLSTMTANDKYAAPFNDVFN